MCPGMLWPLLSTQVYLKRSNYLDIVITLCSSIQIINMISIKLIPPSDATMRRFGVTYLTFGNFSVRNCVNKRRGIVLLTTDGNPQLVLLVNHLLEDGVFFYCRRTTESAY